MKHFDLLIWLTQLGISVAVPLGGFVLLGVWLRQRYDWGVWIIIVCVVIGVSCAVSGLRSSLKAMERLVKNKDKDEDVPPPICFNDHE